MILSKMFVSLVFFFFQAEDGIRDVAVTGVQTCALPISSGLPVCAAISVSRLFREESSASYASRCCSRNASRSCRENGNLPSRGGNCSKNVRLRSRMRCVFRSNEGARSEEHTSELQSRLHLVCRLLLEKKKRVIV